MSKNLKILLSLIIAVSVIFFGWKVIAPSVVKFIVESQKKEEKVGLGSKIDAKFKVIDRFGAEREIGTHFSSNGLVLMVYSPSCSPCREAAADAEERFKNNKNINELPFTILQFNDRLDSKLTSLKAVNILHSKVDRDDSPFAGSSTPTFYQIDKDGVLRQKKIGWYEGILDDMLKKI